MKFALAIYSSPNQKAALAALSFAEALACEKHSLYRLFFFSDGVLNGVEENNPLVARWQALIQADKVDALLCVSSAQKRGISEGGMRPVEGFTIAGLGQLVDAAVQADRLFTFG